MTCALLPEPNRYADFVAKALSLKVEVRVWLETVYHEPVG